MHDAIERFFDDHARHNLKSKSQERYLISYKAILNSSIFDGVFIDEVKRQHIHKFVKYRQSGQLSNATINRDLHFLSSAFTQFINWDMVDSKSAG